MSNLIFSVAGRSSKYLGNAFWHCGFECMAHCRLKRYCLQSAPAPPSQPPADRVAAVTAASLRA
eukprot:1932546-Pleurochrysis_carterae.AAC.2